MRHKSKPAATSLARGTNIVCDVNLEIAFLSVQPTQQNYLPCAKALDNYISTHSPNRYWCEEQDGCDIVL